MFNGFVISIIVIVVALVGLGFTIFVPNWFFSEDGVLSRKHSFLGIGSCILLFLGVISFTLQIVIPATLSPDEIRAHVADSPCAKKWLLEHRVPKEKLDLLERDNLIKITLGDIETAKSQCAILQVLEQSQPDVLIEATPQG